MVPVPAVLKVAFYFAHFVNLHESYSVKEKLHPTDTSARL